MYFKIYINVFINHFKYVYILNIYFLNSNQICKLGNAVNANEAMNTNANEIMLAVYADPDAGNPDANPDAT